VTPLFLALLIPAAVELSLDEALARAAEHDARQRLSKLDEAAAGLAAHEGLGRALPALSVSGSVIRNDKEISRGGAIIQPLWVAGAATQGSLTLLRGSDIPNAWAGYTDAAATGELQREAREELLADVARVYLQLAQAQALEQVRAEQRATAEELLRIAEARVRAGDAVALEEAEARAELLRAEAEVARAAGSSARVQALLALYIGEPADAQLAARCDACLSPPSDPQVARGDLEGLRLRADAASIRGWGSWMRFLPTLQLVGNASLNSQATLFRDPQRWNAQLVLSWTLFDGATRYFGARRSMVLADRAQEEAALAVRTSKVQIQQAKSMLAAARAAEKAALARVDVAQQALAQARVRYREGLLSSIQVTEAARRTAEANAEAVNARFATLAAALDARRAQGLPVTTAAGGDR
jgi:multidrug efflux system outer membrane protein